MRKKPGTVQLDTIPGQGNKKPARYFLSTRLTYRMLVNNIRRTITEAERDAVLVEFTQKLASTGPFRDLKFIKAHPARSPVDVLSTAGLDTAYTTRLVVLDPAQFSLRNGAEADTLEALHAAMGLGQGPGQLPVQWASSIVYAVVNTQRRAQARSVAAEYLARSKALAAPEVQADEELKATGTKELNSAGDQLEKTLRRAYQHVAFIAQPDPDGERYLDQLTFDDDTMTALNGTIVWKGLVARDKVFDAGQFGARALLHNLREQDYGKTLSDIRAAFYSAPRLPLLYEGDRDLQQAMYDAVSAGQLAIVDGNGTPVAVTAAGQINLTSTGLRIAKPQPAACPTCGQPAHAGPCESLSGPGEPAPGSAAAGGGTSAGGAVPAATLEKQVAFSFTSNLLSGADTADGFAALFRAFYMSLDERQISYLQGTINLVVDAAAVDQIQSLLADLGITPTIKDI